MINVRIASCFPAVLAGLLSLSSAALGQVRIISVAPATAQPGSTITVTGNTFPAGVTSPNVTATFAPVTNGAGPTVNAPLTSLATLAGTTMRATLTLPASLTVSSPTPYHVTLSATVAPAFTTAVAGNITINPSPSLSSVNPASGRLTQTRNVAVTGSFSNFFQGISTASFGPGVTVNSVTVASPTSLTANIDITPGAPLGAANVVVTTGSEVRHPHWRLHHPFRSHGHFREPQHGQSGPIRSEHRAHGQRHYLVERLRRACRQFRRWSCP